jgi:hypothetical protein
MNLNNFNKINYTFKVERNKTNSFDLMVKITIADKEINNKFSNIKNLTDVQKLKNKLINI